MNWKESTTALEVMQEFNKSVMQLLDDIETINVTGKKNKVPDRTNAVHTKKMINQWFFHNGGL